ncbi:MAG: hypothetical protein F4X87_11195 [Chloroflexi bacterium]|nr:hypothetical protein [Chloroflexota bacterium]
MPMRILVLATIILLGGLQMVTAQDGANISLTVYNDGAALVREKRQMTLEPGVNSVTIRDVAATIDPTSFGFKSLSDPAGTVVLEQSYRYDKGEADALLADFIGETVEISISADERYSGELLQIQGEKALLRTAPNEIVFVSLYNVRGIKFPAPLDDLYTGPSLQLLLNSDSAGEHEVALSYLAGGMNWNADYSVYLNSAEEAFDLTGLITLRNGSGRAFDNATLKLVAGEVSRIEQEKAVYAEERVMMAMSAAADHSEEVEQRNLSEFKLYAVARPITIADGETKQIEFVSGADIMATINYVFDSSPSFGGYYRPIDYLEGSRAESGDVRTYLAFNTGDASGLGADLPAGRVRVYKADVDGAHLLIGESGISHTAKGDEVLLGLGNAFDLTGERIQTDFSFVSRRVARESFEIRLRNRKDDDPVSIVVPERLYRWRDWQIIQSSAPFVKVDNASIEFDITVAPGAEEALSYTVEYSFPEDGE